MKVIQSIRQQKVSFGDSWSISTKNKEVRNLLKDFNSKGNKNYRLDFIVEPKGTRSISALITNGIEKSQIDSDNGLDKLVNVIFDIKNTIFINKKVLEIKSLEDLNKLIPNLFNK